MSSGYLRVPPHTFLVCQNDSVSFAVFSCIKQTRDIDKQLQGVFEETK